jgi:hypothetical protein
VLRSIAGLGAPFYDDYTFGIDPDLTPAKCAPAETAAQARADLRPRTACEHIRCAGSELGKATDIN